MSNRYIKIISASFGWIYTTSWTLSFFPQPILNVKRKSTSGTTIDFPAINLLGFSAYFVSNLVFLYSPVIRYQYAQRNHGLTPTVEINDLAFSAMAIVMTVITLSQFIPSWWGFSTTDTKARETRISTTISGVMVGAVAGVVITIITIAITGRDDDPLGWAWIDAIYAVSYVKLVVTLIKFTPQVITNHKNKSTEGWSIYQLMFDFAGGILSLAQLILDSWLQGSWSGITGNPVKLGLSNISMFFDVIFMIQHYCLYRGNRRKLIDDSDFEASEEDSLLPNNQY